MARYALGQTCNGTATANAVRWELRSTATDRLYLMELGVFLGAATASILGFGRPNAIGVTPTSPITLLAEDPADPAGTGTTATAWGTAPTLPSNPIRRVNLSAAIGAGIIWTFGPKGLVIPVSSSVILWNIAAASAVVDVYAVLEE